MLNKVWNDEVSDIYLPVGRQQMMRKLAQLVTKKSDKIKTVIKKRELR